MWGDPPWQRLHRKIEGQGGSHPLHGDARFSMPGISERCKSAFSNSRALILIWCRNVLDQASSTTASSISKRRANRQSRVKLAPSIHVPFGQDKIDIRRKLEENTRARHAALNGNQTGDLLTDFTKIGPSKQARHKRDWFGPKASGIMANDRTLLSQGRCLGTAKAFRWDQGSIIINDTLTTECTLVVTIGSNGYRHQILCFYRPIVIVSPIQDNGQQSIRHPDASLPYQNCPWTALIGRPSTDSPLPLRIYCIVRD